MPDDPDDLTECAKAMHELRLDWGWDICLWDELPEGPKLEAAAEARACLRASPLLRDAMALCETLKMLSRNSTVQHDCTGVLARYRKLMED